MSISLQLLKNLARTCSEEADNLEDIDPAVSALKIKEVVKKKQDLLEQQSIDNYAQAVVDIMTAKKLQVSNTVARIRKIREEEVSLLSSIRKLDDLELKALEDNNWLPLANKIGLYIAQ